MEDLSRAFQAALERDVLPELKKGQRFVCIAFSTGGPLVRQWLRDFHTGTDGRLRRCPMSHLIMLAPANFGSALARHGRGRIGRLRAMLDCVEPGEGVLDWLELGSPDAFALNKSWVENGQQQVGARGLYPFVLTGQSIDHALYDHVNDYTDEAGSDGVIRAASANLNARYIRLKQTARPLARDRFEARYVKKTRPGREHFSRLVGNQSECSTFVCSRNSGDCMPYTSELFTLGREDGHPEQCRSQAWRPWL